MQSIRRRLGRGHSERMMTLSFLFRRQPAVAMSKGAKAADKVDGVGDSKMQLMVKALLPQDSRQIELSPEQLREAELR